MIFWIVVAVLTAAVTYWVTRPLLSDASGGVAPETADIAVYKDQLGEIDADVARGQLTATEAEAARTEVARRLLRLAGKDEAAHAGAKRSEIPHKTIHAAAALAVPLLSLALYLAYGNPGLPGNPLKDRLAAAPATASAADLIAKVEARLREAPQDGQGWEVIAPVYASMGRFADAVDAYANAIRILGETPKRLEGLALSDIRAAGGLVTDKARKALARSLAMEPSRTEPRLWLTLGKEQDGDTAGAIKDYKDLLAAAPQDAPWRQAVEGRLKDLEAKDSGAPTAGKPAQAAAPQVSDLPDEQKAMIDKMVAGLAQRLKDNGNDLDGWLMLMRSFKMLGRDQEAVTALADARKQFAGQDKALEAIDALAKSLGI